MMKAEMDSLYQKIQTARPAQRQRILQKAIGHHTDISFELHLRALLMTRLRVDKLWPCSERARELSAFEEDDGA